ncbi:MAG: hypothetical protein H0T89_27035, partial [Deltaproteobacteria bacterium]|nr:hypothetical protein [Deltaproteobacteria bacterium]
MRVVFDPALDGGGWPGPLSARTACFGEARLGPLGLLDRLEVELGLVVARESPTERAAVFARTLATVEGFWSRSFATDRLGTSKRLLADRDALALWGWRGEPASARLAALWQVTAAAATGVPDRLRRILARLPGRQLDIESVHVVEPITAFPPLWQQVLRALAGAGVRIVVEPLAHGPATGDLLAARGTAFR